MLNVDTTTEHHVDACISLKVDITLGEVDPVSVFLLTMYPLWTTTGIYVPTITVKPVCNDHLYNIFFTCDLFSNVFE